MTDDPVRLRAILDSVPNAVVSLDAIGRITEWNKTAEKMFGFSRSEAVNRPMQELIVPLRLREAHCHGFRKFMQTGESKFIDSPTRVPALRKDGSEFSAELLITRTKNEPFFLTAFITDITERWKLETQMKNADETMQALFTIIQHTGIIVFSKDRGGRFVNANKPMLDLLGQDLLGKTVKDILSEEDAAVSNAHEAQLYESGEVRTDEEVVGIGGTQKSFIVTRICRKDCHGSVIGMYAIALDITEYKEVLLKASENERRRLQLSEQLALASNKAKTDFLANMSHEIRTPVNGIVGFTTLLKDTQTSPEQDELIEGIIMASGSLMSIINDILDISKIEAGRVELEIIDANICEVIRELSAMFAYTVKQKGLTLIVKNELPAEVCWIRCDQGRLRQILNNLLSNAVKFTFHGTIELKVWLSAGDKGDAGGEETPDGNRGMITFAIRDSGIGIPADKQDTLFRPFTQAETSTTRRFGGTGLGLSISKNLVQLMGGEISFKSVEGEGTTFTFHIPYQPGTPRSGLLEPDDNEGDGSSSGSDSPGGNGEPRKFVLVVDDNRTNIKLTMKMLEKVGVNVSGSENGAEAVSLLQSFPTRYGLVLMDCQMPVMDGYEATHYIRNLPEPLQSIPIIAMTANALKGEKERCLELGMNDYVSKPVDMGALLKKVRKWLR